MFVSTSEGLPLPPLLRREPPSPVHTSFAVEDYHLNDSIRRSCWLVCFARRIWIKNCVCSEFASWKWIVRAMILQTNLFNAVLRCVCEVFVYIYHVFVVLDCCLSNTAHLGVMGLLERYGVLVVFLHRCSCYLFIRMFAAVWLCMPHFFYVAISALSSLLNGERGLTALRRRSVLATSFRLPCQFFCIIHRRECSCNLLYLNVFCLANVAS